MTASASSRGAGRGSALRRAAVLVLGLLGVVLAAMVATAATAAPTITGVAPNAGYTTLTVTFSEELASSSAGTGDLTAASFELHDAGVAKVDVTLTATKKSATSYELTVPAGKAIPNVTSVVVPSGKAWTATDKTAVPAMSYVVPLTGSDAVRAVTALATVTVDGEPFAPMPFVGSWFASLRPVTTTAGGSSLKTAAGVAPVGPPTTDAQSAEQELVSQPLALTSMVTGLAAALVPSATTTQDSVEAALEAVAGVKAVTFTNGGLRVELDPAESAGTHRSDQLTEVAALPYAVDGVTSFALHLGGTIDIALPATGPATLQALDVRMQPQAFALPATSTVGMVAVTTDARATRNALTLNVSCVAASCPATPTVTAGGSLGLEIGQVVFADGGGEETVDVTSGGDPVEALWSPGTWDFAGLAALTEESSPAAQALLADLAPVVSNRDAWDDADLPQFAQLDSHAVTLALEWVGSWLRSTDGVEALGTQLPAVGLSVGDVLQLSDQVGARVTALVDALEPDGTSPLGVPDPTAQDVLRALCAQDMLDCDGGLDGLDIGTDEITYDVELEVCKVLFGDEGTCDAPAGVAVESAGPALDLAAGDAFNDDLGDLGGITATLRTGEWEGTATASLAFRLTLDLRPDAAVKADLQVTEADYPGPGFPDTARLAPGDLCRGLALQLGSTATTFAAANGELVDGSPTLACDRLAWDPDGTFAEVVVPAEEPAAARTVQVTAADVCAAAALKNGLQLDPFLVLNGVDAAACATRAFEHVSTPQTVPVPAEGQDRTYPVDVGDGAAFVYYRAPVGQPLPVSFRLSIDELGSEPLVSADVDVSATDVGGDVSLGFLDLALSGDISAEPSVEVGLSSADRLTLVDLAEAADSATPTVTLGAMLDTELGGTLEVDLSLANDLAFPDGAATFRLQGDIGDLVAGDADSFADCADLGDDDTGVCYELGDWPDVSEMTPAQVLRMVTGLLDRVAGLAGAGDAAFELPLVGVSVQDLVGFNTKLRDLADTVETREPESLSALQEALDAGMVAAGLPAGTIVVEVADDVLTLRLPLGVTEEATYPFGFDVGFGEQGGMPVRISPSDGGARVTASGSASFTPTLGIDLSATITDDLDEHVFLVVDEADDPTLGGSVDATISGDVTFGPLTTDFSGSAKADPSVTLKLSELPGDGDGNRLTLSRIAELMDPESGEDLPEEFLDWDGDFSLDASVTGPVGPIELGWSATLDELLAGETGTFTDLPSPADMLGLKLDLATLVRGTSQTTRFVGRALAESDALSTSLPLVGEELAALSAVGDDLQVFAGAVDDLYAEVEENDEEFVADINATLDAEVCGALADVGECRAELVLFTDGEVQDVPDVTTADGVELQLTLAKEESLTLGTPKILDVPGFEVDTEADLSLRAGYRLGLTLGVDVESGFYVKGFDVGQGDLTRLLELYGRADIDSPGGGGIKIGGVTAFTLDALDMSLGGTLGPDDDGAGFALDMPEPLTLMDVVNGRRSIDEIFEPRISVDVDAQITIGTPDGGGSIPALAFPVWFAWEMEGVIGGGLELDSPSLSIGNEEEDSYVTIDVTSLVNDVVRPALLELNKYNPVAQAAPVKDALNSQVPVLDQSVRGLLDGALGGDPRWQLLSFLLDLDDVATSLADAPGATSVLIPLGGYTVLPAEDSGYFSPAADGVAYTVWDVPELKIIKDLVENLSAAAGGAKKFSKPTPTVPAKPGAWDGNLNSSSSSSFTGTPPKKPTLKQVVRMPILDNPLSAATLLFGGEVEPISFIEIAPPAVDFGMSVKFERTLFDLNLGAIEARLSVGLEGAVGVTLRVGIGYSSHGLTSGDPLNGLYLVDAYDGNRALPMVALGGRVSVRVDGRFSVVGIAEAEFSGSGYVRLEGGLDLFDESLTIPEAGRGDGMFHVDEILRVVDGHRIGATKSAADAFCIFRPTVQLQAGLAFSATAKVLGMEVWSGSYADDWDLVDEEWSCAYVERVAQLVERTVVLAAGPTAGERLGALSETNESFTISQTGSTLTVSGAGAFAGFRPMSFSLDGIDEVLADLGEGDDSVVVDASVTVPVKLYGGPGNDTLKGGAGDDVLDGGEGVDTIETRGGDDEVVIGADGVRDDADLTVGDGLGCTGCNVVVLGGGNDVVTGGPAPVVYRSAAGDFGHARIEHSGPTMVVDLGASSDGVDAVIDALGLHVTSPQGSIDNADPSVLARFIGSAGSDRIRVADGVIGMYVDGGGSDDVVTVETNGVDRTARVHDSGAASVGPCDSDCGDRLVVRGTTAAERFLLRAHVKGSPVTGPDRSPAAAVPANEGVVAVLSPESETQVAGPLAEHPEDAEAYEYTGAADATQLVFYDPTLESLLVEGVAGEDEFALDDVATSTTVEGGRGTDAGVVGSSFQVGQIFGWQTDSITDPDGEGGVAALRTPLTPDHPVTPWGDDQFRYRESIRGWLSYGISHPTTVRGGLSDDKYTVYSNRANLKLEGVGGDDVFTLRSFIANGSIVAAGGDGDDTFNYDFAYVSNNEVDIEGGTGFNTFVVIGTELQDGFTVTEDGVSVCVPKGSAATGLDDRVTRAPGIAALPLQPDPTAPVGATGTCAVRTSATGVQRYVLAGLEGNNVFWVRGAPAGSETFLIGGRDGSTYLVGDDGDLSQVKGTVEVVADLDNLSAAAAAALEMVDLEFPLPVLLDGDVTYSPVAALIPSDAVDREAESTLVVDGSATSSALSGELVRDPAPATATAGIRLSGLTSATAATFALAKPDADGTPRTYDVRGGIGVQGLDTLRVVLGSGDDALHVRGTHSPYDGVGDALGRDGRTEVYAGAGADDLQLDGVHGPTWVALEDGADATRIGTGTASGVRHPIEVYGGDGADDVEVDASDRTTALRADLDRVADLDPTWTGLPAAVDLAVLTGLEMPSLVRHDGEVDVFRVETGSAADVVNARGSLAGQTQLRTGAMPDRVFLSSAADSAPGTAVPGLLGGTLSDLRDVDLDAGAGDNLLMISDRDSGIARRVTMSAVAPDMPPQSDTSTVGMKAASFAVTDGPTITFDAGGGTFTRGISAWLGDQADTVDVLGVRRDGSDLAVAGWETARPPGSDARRTVTTLSTGAGADTVTSALPRSAGLLVVNLEEGDDSLLDAGATGGVVAFGGDGADRLQAGAGDDLVFGDWGRVEYRSAAGALLAVLGVPDRLDLVPGAAAAPFVVAACTSQPTVSASGVLGCAPVTATTGVRNHDGLTTPVRNWISVGDGDDIAIGGAGSDWLDATAGQNALVADLGAVRRVRAATGVVRSGEGFLDVTLPTLPFAYSVSGLDDSLGSRDAVLGGAGRDWVFTGVGDDLVNGRAGDDLVFAGHGHDVLWGGTGADHLYGGTGDDSIDLKRMLPGTGTKAGTTADWPVSTQWWKALPLLMPDGWATFAPGVDIDVADERLTGIRTDNGLDVVYGGDGQDAMQADAGGAGRVPGDRLVDWFGAHNVYYVCDGAYGAGYVLRVSSPSIEAALKQLATADGEVATSSGVLRQLALVTSGNRNPTHPAHPGNNHGC